MPIEPEELAHACTVSIGEFDDGWRILFEFADGRSREIGPFADKDTALFVISEFDREVAQIEGVHSVKFDETVN